MCTTCGCGSDEVVVTDPDHRHDHDHHGEGHVHVHDRSARTIVLEQAVLAKNDVLAEANRSWFAEQRILAVNHQRPARPRIPTQERDSLRCGTYQRIRKAIHRAAGAPATKAKSA